MSVKLNRAEIDSCFQRKERGVGGFFLSFSQEQRAIWWRWRNGERELTVSHSFRKLLVVRGNLVDLK